MPRYRFVVEFDSIAAGPTVSDTFRRAIRDALDDMTVNPVTVRRVVSSADRGVSPAPKAGFMFHRWGDHDDDCGIFDDTVDVSPCDTPMNPPDARLEALLDEEERLETQQRAEAQREARVDYEQMSAYEAAAEAGVL